MVQLKLVKVFTYVQDFDPTRPDKNSTLQSGNQTPTNYLLDSVLVKIVPIVVFGPWDSHAGYWFFPLWVSQPQWTTNDLWLRKKKILEIMKRVWQWEFWMQWTQPFCKGWKTVKLLFVTNGGIFWSHVLRVCLGLCVVSIRCIQILVWVFLSIVWVRRSFSLLCSCLIPAVLFLC